MSVGDGLPNLNNVTFASDRGYWTASLLFLYVLAAGADVIGTIKRCAWFPFTFDQNPEPNKSHNVPSKGYKSAFYRWLKFDLHDSQSRLLRNLGLTAVAYRSGTSSYVSLLLSSRHHTRHWELNTLCAKDSKWYFDGNMSQKQRNKKWVTYFCGDDSAQSVDAIIESACPRTTRQGTVEWFLDRAYSLTLSTTKKW